MRLRGRFHPKKVPNSGFAGTTSEAVLLHRDSLSEGQTELSTDEYLVRPHILVQYGGYSGTVDATLLASGASRNIVAMTSHFCSLPWLIFERRCANVPEHAARAMCALNAHLRFVEQPLPHNQTPVIVAFRRDSALNPLIACVKDALTHVLRQYPWHSDRTGNCKFA